MTLVYSATLGNQFDRGTVLMGHDASMELGNILTIYADPRSTKYKEMIAEGKIDPTVPIYQYDPTAEGVDAVTSATAKYFANKGLLWTYRDGKRVDSTFLHIREWLSCIRNGGNPSCGIDEGFEEAITAHMAGLSYKTGQKSNGTRSVKRLSLCLAKTLTLSFWTILLYKFFPVVFTTKTCQLHKLTGLFLKDGMIQEVIYPTKH